MVKLWQTLLFPSLLFTFINAAPVTPPSYLAIRTIYEFPNETWVENIAVRSNGNLLLNLLSTPTLYELNPFNPAPGSAELLHTFPFATGLAGIAEIEPDVFAILAGNWSLETFSTTPGSWSVWKADFRHGDIPAISKIADVTKASFLNGMTLLAPGSPFLLIADSVLGVVWRLNYLTSEYEIILQSPLMQPIDEAPILGINGIHVFNSSVYFTNSFKGLFAKVPVTLEGPNAGSATGEYEVVAKNGVGDDFIFDKEGNAYITQDPSDALQLVNQEGQVTVLAGNTNSTLLEGDTADAFGRTKSDENILYVVTNGGIAKPVPGTQIVGGKVIAVDVKALFSV